MIPSIQKRRVRKSEPAKAEEPSVNDASTGETASTNRAIGYVDPDQGQPGQLAEQNRPEPEPEPWAAVDPEAGTVSVLDMRSARAIARTAGAPDRSIALLVVAAYERGRAAGLAEG